MYVHAVCIQVIQLRLVNRSSYCTHIFKGLTFLNQPDINILRHYIPNYFVTPKLNYLLGFEV